MPNPRFVRGWFPGSVFGPARTRRPRPANRPESPAAPRPHPRGNAVPHARRPRPLGALPRRVADHRPRPPPALRPPARAPLPLAAAAPARPPRRAARAVRGLGRRARPADGARLAAGGAAGVRAGAAGRGPLPEPGHRVARAVPRRGQAGADRRGRVCRGPGQRGRREAAGGEAAGRPHAGAQAGRGRRGGPVHNNPAARRPRQAGVGPAEGRPLGRGRPARRRLPAPRRPAPGRQARRLRPRRGPRAPPQAVRRPLARRLFQAQGVRPRHLRRPGAQGGAGAKRAAGARPRARRRRLAVRRPRLGQPLRVGARPGRRHPARQPAPRRCIGPRPRRPGAPPRPLPRRLPPLPRRLPPALPRLRRARVSVPRAPHTQVGTHLERLPLRFEGPAPHLPRRGGGAVPLGPPLLRRRRARALRVGPVEAAPHGARRAEPLLRRARPARPGGRLRPRAGTAGGRPRGEMGGAPQLDVLLPQRRHGPRPQGPRVRVPGARAGVGGRQPVARGVQGGVEGGVRHAGAGAVGAAARAREGEGEGGEGGGDGEAAEGGAEGGGGGGEELIRACGGVYISCTAIDRGMNRPRTGSARAGRRVAVRGGWPRRRPGTLRRVRPVPQPFCSRCGREPSRPPGRQPSRRRRSRSPGKPAG
ncbi:hypothetical protein DFJ74DRAFT_717649, partial [Hyaloraphidium curvatum]